MRGSRARFVAVSANLAAAMYASAASAQWAADCNAYPSEVDKVSAMRVTGSEPTHFFEMWVDGCERSAEHCQKRSYVLPGDHVLAADAGAGFFCAWYLDRKGHESWGLLNANRLARAPADVPSPGDLSAWSGHWRLADLATAHAARNDGISSTGDIAIVADRRGLRAAGDTTFPYRNGAGDLAAQNYEFGPVNQNWDSLTAPSVAQQGVAVVLKNGLATITDEDCRIQMRRIGDLLVVVEISQCGGRYVNFSGFYSRVGPVPKPSASKP